MFEPRGHDMMSGAILYPPTRPDCDVGLLFIETSGCLPMCGHGTIGTVTIALENGLIQPRTPGPLRLDTPAGLVEARYEQNGPFIESVRITNVPSFLLGRGYRGRCGRARPDPMSTSPMAAISTRSSSRRLLYSDLADVSPSDILRWSPRLRRAFNERYEIAHPENPAIDRLHPCPLDRPRRRAEARRGNAVFYGDKAIDRSPCGTGTSARMAQLAAAGPLAEGRSLRAREHHRLDLHGPHRRAHDGRST